MIGQGNADCDVCFRCGSISSTWEPNTVRKLGTSAFYPPFDIFIRPYASVATHTLYHYYRINATQGNSKNTLGRVWAHSGHTQRTLREHSERIQRTLRGHSENTQKHSKNTSTHFNIPRRAIAIFMGGIQFFLASQDALEVMRVTYILTYSLTE